jgi:hypothetical protein
LADVTERLSAKDYLAMVAARPAPARRRSKFGNTQSVSETGEKYDSNKERNHHAALEAARHAKDPSQRVVEIILQQKFELIPKQDGERAVNYFADFVVTYADGRREVQDTKSEPTRRDKAYVMKRKLMLRVHGIRIIEL